MKIVLTTIPVERTSAGVFRVSVAVGFLSDDKALLPTEIEALSNWPLYLSELAKSDKLAFSVSFDDGEENSEAKVVRANYDWTEEPWDPGLWDTLVWKKPYKFWKKPYNTNMGEAVTKAITVNERPANIEFRPVTSMPTAEVNESLENLYSKELSNQRERLKGLGFLKKNLSDYERAIMHRIARRTLFEYPQSFDPLKWEARDASGTSLPTDMRLKNADKIAAFEKLLQNKPDAAVLQQRNLARISATALTTAALSHVNGIVVDAYPMDTKSVIKADSEEDQLTTRLLSAAIFHRRIPNPDPGVRAVGNGKFPSALADPQREVDVFERIALLRNYPTHSVDKESATGVGLLRSLGLTVDLAFKLDDPKVDLNGRYCIRVEVKEFAGLHAPICPKTRYVWDEGRTFRAADRRKGTEGQPEDPWLKEGFLTVGDSTQFALVTLDCDGTSQKVIEAIKNVADTEGLQVLTEPHPPFHLLKTGCNLRARGLLNKVDDRVELLTCLSPFGTAGDLDELKAQFKRMGMDDEKGPDRVWEEMQFEVNLVFPGILDARNNPKKSTRIIARSVRAGGKRIAIHWQLFEEGVYRETASPALPAPRSGGIALAWKTRKDRIKQAQERTKELIQKGANAVLYAADLVLGYVPEVLLKHPKPSKTGEWLSLTARYEKFGNIPARYHRLTNGVLRLSTARTLDLPAHMKQMKLDDVHVGGIVFSWNGGSLGASTPSMPELKAHDFKHFAGFRTELLGRQTPLATHLWSQLSDDCRVALEDNSALAALLLADELSALLPGKSLWTEDRFRGIELSAATQGIIDEEKEASASKAERDGRSSVHVAALLNRKLLEDAYPEYILRGSLGNPGLVLQDSQAEERKSLPKGRWGLDPQFAAHQIPPLRFVPPTGGPEHLGIYKFRVRIVDLAGNQARDSESSDTVEEICYHRYEPVPAPELLLDEHPRKHTITKRGLSRMVVRMGYDTDIRWGVPPRTSLSMVETHGLLDRVTDLRNVRSFEDIALTIEGDFPVAKADDPPNLNPVNSRPSANPGENYPLRLPSRASGKRIIPYFPDPLARGVTWALEYLASDKSSPCQTRWLGGESADFIPFYPEHRWPRARAFQIILKATEEHEPAARWSNSSRSLTIHLPTGLSARLHLSSSMEKADNLGILKLGDALLKSTVTTTPPVEGGEFSPLAGGEFIPLLTGSRTIDLISAVRRPTLAPFIASICKDGTATRKGQEIAEIKRNIGEVKVDLEFDVHAEVQSTGKLRFIASWEGPASSDDDGVSPQRIRGHADLGEFQLAEWLAGNPWKPNTELPALPLQRFQHALPDTGFRLVQHVAVGTTRFLEYFDDVNDKNQFELSSAPRLVAMLNCAPPPVPEFAYFVPTFDWRHYADRGKFHSERRKFLRLFLAGPWDLTGDDEMIGICVWPNQQQPLNSAERKVMRQWATCWGQDPLRTVTPNAAAGPKASHFESFAAFAAGEIIDLPSLANKLYRPTNGRPLTKDISTNLLPATRASLRRYIERERDSSSSGRDDHTLRTELAADFGRFVRGEISNKQITRKQFQEEFSCELLLSNLLGQDETFFKFGGTEINWPNTALSIVPYRPEFDDKRKIWYCDVPLGNLPADDVFVRFALARFQPHSVDEVSSLSKIILVDFAQLGQDRYLTVFRKTRLQLQVQLVSGTIASERERERILPPLLLKKEERSGLWIKDNDIKWTGEESLSGHVLLSGFFTWPDHTTARRLVIREQRSEKVTKKVDAKESLKDLIIPSNDPAAFETYPYMEILDV